MRWDRLFEDVEAEWARLRREGLQAEAAELTRGEWASLTLVDRLRAQRGAVVRFHLLHGTSLEVGVQSIGEDWVGGRVRGGESVVVRIAAVAAVEADLAGARVPAQESAASPRLTALLRRIARARALVDIIGIDGRPLAQGSVDRVGVDHVDVSRRTADEPRRPGGTHGALTIPLTALAAIRSRQPF